MTTATTTSTVTDDHAAAGARHTEQLGPYAGLPTTDQPYPWRRFGEEIRNAIHWFRAAMRPDNPDLDSNTRRARLALNAAHSAIERHGAYGEGNAQQRDAYDAVNAVRVEMLRRYGPLF